MRERRTKHGRGIPYAAPSLYAGPSGDALECHFVTLLGIVVQATTFVARLVIIPILTATRSAEDLFSGSSKTEQARFQCLYQRLTCFGTQLELCIVQRAIQNFFQQHGYIGGGKCRGR